jgi:hypothetical protein
MLLILIQRLYHIPFPTIALLFAAALSGLAQQSPMTLKPLSMIFKKQKHFIYVYIMPF